MTEAVPSSERLPLYRAFPQDSALLCSTLGLVWPPFNHPTSSCTFTFHHGGLWNRRCRCHQRHHQTGAVLLPRMAWSEYSDESRQCQRNQRSLISSKRMKKKCSCFTACTINIGSCLIRLNLLRTWNDCKCRLFSIVCSNIPLTFNARQEDEGVEQLSVVTEREHQ